MTQPFNPISALAWIFRMAEDAGWGIANGPSFEAFPGLEDAAADYIEALLEGDQQ